MTRSLSSLMLLVSLVLSSGLPWMTVALLSPAAPPEGRSSMTLMRRRRSMATTLRVSPHEGSTQRRHHHNRVEGQNRIQTLLRSSESGSMVDDGRYTCKVCRRTFPSRNALFRHLVFQAGGTSAGPQTCGGWQNAWPAAGSSASLSDKRAGAVVPFRIAIRFGYCHHKPHVGNVVTDMKPSVSSPAVKDVPSMLSVADAAADWVLQSIQQERPDETSRVGAGVARDPCTLMDGVTCVTISSVTRASDAKLRASCLKQEEDCAAAGDVMVVTGVARTDSVSFTSSSCISLALPNRLLTGPSPAATFENSGVQVRVDAVKVLDRPLHAERSTQYIYHYLLPISWLLDPSHELVKWVNGWGRLNAISSPASDTPSSNQRPRALLRLKHALRRMESPRFTPSSLLSTDEGEGYDGDRHLGQQLRRRRKTRVAAGRFGGLAFKTRQAFHNYCDQGLMGAVSPSHDVVWRCVDRARIVGFVTSNNTEANRDASISANLVLEFRGDAFLRHQIRTMVGTAVVMANDWLPMETTVSLSTSPNHIVSPLPCAPTGRLYLAATRFHFEEMSTSGRSLFSSSTDGFVIKSESHGGPQDELSSGRSNRNIEWIQTMLLSQKENSEELRSEKNWLRTVETCICPATRAAFEATNCETSVNDRAAPAYAADSRPLSPTPDVYKQVLAQLRSIVERGTWPETSAARSSVIRYGDSTQIKGSFTVVNPSIVVDMDTYTLGNELFPDLVKEVFALEQALSHNKRDIVKETKGKISSSQTSSFRVASSHCTINCRAQFLPHVDTGRGAGQTISLIVGLGDYHSGELGVEGSLHDIRYRPLEFDAWKLRHWTRPFHGERFSLVWFIPAKGLASRHSIVEVNNSI